MKRDDKWKVVGATWTDKEPYTLTVSFADKDGGISSMANTMPADTWCAAMHLKWWLDNERKYTAELGKRLSDLLDENFELKLQVSELKHAAKQPAEGHGKE